MLRLLRQICIGLTVTLMVAVQGFALRDAQHRLEHAVQFPGVDYVDVAVIASGPDHDHDHGHSHGHDHNHGHHPYPHADHPLGPKTLTE